MANINFVPDDYIQKRESCRANWFYLVLFLMLLGALGGTFGIIKVRQNSLKAKAQIVNQRMAKAQDAIKQLEQLQNKRKAMMKTALLTAELIEPVPRSVLLALLTNDLPTGVSLLRVKLEQNEPPAKAVSPTSATKYQAAQNSSADSPLSREKLLLTKLEIEGVAPSDIEVAAFIKNLDNSILLHKVGLVHSKEHEIDETKFRQFKLNAELKPNIHLSTEDIQGIRQKQELNL